MKCKRGYKQRGGKCVKVKKGFKKSKFQTWWKTHWAEVVFLTSIALSIYFILKGTGYF
ncbi:MAG: hypothetical protein U9Q73_00345 [Nanoarchaeota archaeon]|nr:hypothetical protein [Nanoarchaeota archaeon]